ncbi:glutamine--fructose-6-phosphate transaminase (isomerizing) [Candidatus Bathyarchaeota archaeon]|nr:MAG: glutamine--fructose-6-phosphate transaminase (isomerizing) [Candidatus Bathyarchaeota archaeon]
MCGIIGVAALEGEVAAKVKRGLKRLEYRGYDSVGIASLFGGKIYVKKGKGKLDEVDSRLNLDLMPGRLAVGHTRWATHAAPSDANAHPHTDCKNLVAVVHNGIIENYLELKKELTEKGHAFRSETDTEVLAHLIEEGLERGLRGLEALRYAVKRARGSYAIAVLMVGEEDKIFFARKLSPLVIGLGNGANYVASDIPAFLEYTQRVMIVHDDEIGYITPTEVHLERVDGTPVDVGERVIVVDWTPEMAMKGGYPHYMLKEIHEQPLALAQTYRGLGPELEEVGEALHSASRVFLVAAGTSFHATLVFDYLLNKMAGIAAVPLIASEYFKYTNTVGEGDIVVAVSQSGETVDTLRAVREFRARGAKVVAVTNVIGSALTRESDLTVYTRAGPEIGVAATKTFTTQLLVLSALAVSVAKARGRVSESEASSMIRQLGEAADMVNEVINRYEGWAKRIAETIAAKQNMYYLGRGVSVPVAMEGALKMKEIAYVHAEAYPAGESKHGPIALIEKGFPVVFVSIEGELSKLLLGNVEEMRARGAYTIGVMPPRDKELIEKIHEVVIVPEAPLHVAPIVYIVPLQMMAYYTAVKRGYDPDKPRNLAKTVTVE